MKKIKKHHRLFVVAAIIYIFGAIVFVATEYYFEREKVIETVDKELFMTIDAAQYILPENYGDRATTKDGVSAEEYNNIKDLFTQYARRYNVQYLYAMYRAPDGVIYETATSSEVADEEPFYFFRPSGEMFEGRIDELNYLFDPNPDKNPTYLEYYDAGLLTYNRVACKRFLSTLGIPYVICADSDLDTVEAKLKAYALNQLNYLFFLFIMVIPLFVAYRARSKYNEEMLNKLVEQRTEELSIALKEANRLSNAKSEFLAHMSHELRTPLNAIIGFAQLLKTVQPTKEKCVEYGELIHSSGQHLLSLISDILDLSKVESNRYVLCEENINISKMIEAIRGIISGYKNANKKHISYNADKNVPIFYADERMMRQILLNLLSNAIKFTDKPDSRISLEAKYNEATREVYFIVSDNGIGIDEKDHKAIFEPFQQSSNASPKQREGTGLGLALVHRFVDLHGGSVKLESKLGEGAKFTIKFPASRSVLV